MVRYVLKRLVWLIFTLWLICSLVFFLSKAVPGTCLDWQLGEFGQTINSTKITTGQSGNKPVIPLFYFSVHSRAVPDTLYRMQPEQHQQFFKNLILLSGNRAAVQAFYQTIINLQKSAAQLPNLTLSEKQQLRYQLELIFALADKTQLEQALLRIKNQVSTRSYPVSYREKVTLAQQQCQAIFKKKQILNVLMPAVTWYGFTNEYHIWFTNFIQGNLGTSCLNQDPVNEVIAEAFANTFVITVLSLGLIFILASELSIWLSNARRAKWKQTILSLLYALDSVPLFIVALILITLFASNSYFNIFPAFGSAPDSVPGVPAYLTWVYQLPYLALPVISLTLSGLPYVTGQTYQAIQQLLSREFVLVAKAKGLPEQLVLRRHVWRNALLTLITLFTGFLPVIITGAVIIENIFAIPGMGRLLYHTILARDFPVLIGIVLYLGLIKILAHVLADILYYLADPRIKVPA